MVDDKESEWQKLEWAKKVELCEQGSANENNLLQSYRFIFIALEAILFAAVFGVMWDYLVGVVFVSILGMFLAYLWWHVTKLRGEAVDRWEKILYELWKKQVDSSQLDEWEKKILSEFVRRYEGGSRRWERKRYGQAETFSAKWRPTDVVRSARWWLTLFIPFLVGLAWIAVMIVKIVGTFD